MSTNFIDEQRPIPEVEQLKTWVLDALEDMKAQNITVIDVRDKSNVTDIMVIASGSSARQVKSQAEKVIERVKQHGLKPLGIEGEQTAEWILVDLGDVVVHLMQPSIREFYHLEKLWNTELIDSA